MTKHWIQFAIGFWVLLSPWFLGFSEVSLGKWSNVLVGLVLIIWSSLTIFGEPKAEPEKGRGIKN